MECEIKRDFRGEVNGYEFENQNAYFAVANIIDTLECKHKRKFDDFELAALIADAYFLYQNLGLSVEKFENSCIQNISKGSLKFFPKNKKTKEFNELLGGLLS